MANLRRILLILVQSLVSTGWFAAAASAQYAPFEAADSPGVTATRQGSTVRLELDSSVDGSLAMPRLAAPLKKIAWIGTEASTGGLSIKPEQLEWIISWDVRPATATGIELQFDAPPILMSEIRPIEASGDGSFWLPAHYGQIAGEKIRYEPQTFKNTVGYWVGKQDQVVWDLQVAAPGKFNVGILQGCGRGQGGSQAKVTVESDGSDSPQSLEFDVLETGHFQNFQWRHLGSVELSSEGVYQLTIAPVAIKRNALMDVRTVHLIRLPAGQ